jgi:hypothetical protein
MRKENGMNGSLAARADFAALMMLVCVTSVNCQALGLALAIPGGALCGMYGASRVVESTMDCSPTTNTLRDEFCTIYHAEDFEPAPSQDEIIRAKIRAEDPEGTRDMERKLRAVSERFYGMRGNW